VGERGGGEREILPQIIMPGQIITFGGGRVRLGGAMKKGEPGRRAAPFSLVSIGPGDAGR